MEITTTKGAKSEYLDVLVYGTSGVGKTYAISTIPGKVLLLSAERGTLSLSDHDIDMITINDWKHFIDTLNEIAKLMKAGQFDYTWLAVDSLSEVAERCFKIQDDDLDHGMQAYNATKKLMMHLVRTLRNMPINKYIICKQGEDSHGKGMPSLPGKKLQGELPHHFDEVFAMHSIVDGSGIEGRVFQTAANGEYLAKDRSGKLDKIEVADLSVIVEKILGTSADEKTEADASKKKGKEK